MPHPATVWVDADASPRAIRDVLVRASQRREVPVVFVANRWIDKPRGLHVRCVHVRSGPDEADDYIVEQCAAGDLVVTYDIPLAARVIEKGATVVQAHGAPITPDNVAERVAMRDLKEQLRETGVMTGGPPPFGPKDTQSFANALDRWITTSS